MNRVYFSALLVTLMGCAGVPKESGIMHSIPAHVQVSAVELRVRVRALADDIGGRIEASADEIREASSDRKVRHNALLWKMGSIPSFQATTFSPDPAGALADTWVLAVQMRELFKGDAGTSFFGEYRSNALSTAAEIEGLCANLVRGITSAGDFARARERVESWAAEDPIADLRFQRKSIYAELKSGALREGVDGLSTLQGVATMAEQIEDIEGYLTLFNKHLPSRIRWQVDLLSEELLRDVDTEAAVGSLVQIGETAREISPVIQKLPAMVASERTAIFDSVAEERKLALKEIDDLIRRREDFVDATRSNLQSFAATQRAALIEDVARERRAVLEELKSLTAETVVSLRAERAALVADLESSGSRLIEDGEARASRLIDRIFLRLAVVVGAALVVALLGGWLLIRLSRSRIR